MLITDMLYFLLACLIPHPGAVNDEVVRKGRASKEKKARASYRGKGKGKASASKSSRVAVSGSARRAPVNSTRSKRGQRSRLNRLFAKSIRCSEERGVAAKAHSKDVAVALSRSDPTLQSQGNPCAHLIILYLISYRLLIYLRARG